MKYQIRQYLYENSYEYIGAIFDDHDEAIKQYNILILDKQEDHTINLYKIYDGIVEMYYYNGQLFNN